MDSITEKYIYMVVAIIVMAFIGYFLLLLNWRKESTSKSLTPYKTYNNKIFAASAVCFLFAYVGLIAMLQDITNLSCHFDNTGVIVFGLVPIVLFYDNHAKKSGSYEAKDIENWMPKVITIGLLVMSLGKGIYYTYTDTSCNIYDDDYIERVM